MKNKENTPYQSPEELLKELEKIQKLKKDIENIKMVRRFQRKISQDQKMFQEDNLKLNQLMAGNQLRQLRKKHRLTLLELAKRMGVSRSYLVKLETGQGLQTQEQLEITKAFIEGKM